MPHKLLSLKEKTALNYVRWADDALKGVNGQSMLYVAMPMPQLATFEQTQVFGKAVSCLVDCGLLKFEVGYLSVPRLGREFLEYAEDKGASNPTPELVEALSRVELDVRLRSAHPDTRPVAQRATSQQVSPPSLFNFWTVLLGILLILGLVRLLAGPK